MPKTLNKRIRYLVLAIIVAGLVFGLLFYTPPHGGLWTQVFFDSVHVPVFGLIAVSIFWLWRPEMRWSLRASVAFALACVLGLSSELAQIATSRDASATDLLADCVGAAGFLSLAIALPGYGLPLIRRAVLALVGTALLGWALAPLAIVTAAYIERDAQFPQIFKADSDFGRRLIRLQNIRYDVVSEADRIPAYAKITFLDAPWPGISHHDLAPNWTGYTLLVVDLEVMGEESLSLNLRVHDEKHRRSKRFNDRFNRSFDLEPGRHKLSIPLVEIADAPESRSMDLSKVSELILFGKEVDAGRSFRLYSIRLE